MPRYSVPPREAAGPRGRLLGRPSLPPSVRQSASRRLLSIFHGRNSRPTDRPNDRPDIKQPSSLSLSPFLPSAGLLYVVHKLPFFLWPFKKNDDSGGSEELSTSKHLWQCLGREEARSRRSMGRDAGREWPVAESPLLFPRLWPRGRGAVVVLDKQRGEENSGRARSDERQFPNQKESGDSKPCARCQWPQWSRPPSRRVRHLHAPLPRSLARSLALSPRSSDMTTNPL